MRSAGGHGAVNRTPAGAGAQDDAGRESGGAERGAKVIQGFSGRETGAKGLSTGGVMLRGGAGRGRRTDNGGRPEIAAAGRLDERARRHDEAADFWLSHGDPARGDLERCNAEVHRMAAEMQRQRAALALADS